MAKDYKGKRKQEVDYVTDAAHETGNRPPHAPEIEEAVVGAMMVDSECVYPAIEALTEKSFYTPKIRLIFKAILTLFNKRSAIDIMTVSEQLREDGVLDEVGGPTKLASLTTNVGSAANIEYYIKILQQKTIQRDLIAAGYGILKKAFDETYDVDRLMDESQTEVYNAIQGNMRSAYTDLSVALNLALDRIQRSQQSTGLTGIPSGFPTLDKITMGWQEGNLIVIGARPGHGKTAIALNMARCAAVDHGIPTAFFTLEMTSLELADRIIGTETGLSSDKRKGRVKMKDDEWEQLERGLARAAKAPLYIDETPGLTISEFTSKIKRMKAEKDIKIAFVDYLQLMHVSAAFAQYRALEIGEISRQLKETAKELKIPIIALAQLNRNLTTRIGTSNGRPRLSDLKDSGSIEQDADMVLFIHRPALLGLSESNEDQAELIIEKNRSGETAIIKMTFSGDQVKFTDNAVSLQSYADAIAEKQMSGPSEAPAWDVVSGVVGGYNPFDTFEGNQQF
ncbi:MAG: replicative DNA helicase [Bacteroidales bacterium]|nr:replicative DNA helicase [Bacteroidales bacterium]